MQEPTNMESRYHEMQHLSDDGIGTRKSLIEAVGLTHTFDYTLYENISLTMGEGESLAIVGRSGSGKSTLLHNLSGFLPPNEGSVSLLGKDIYSLDDEDLEKLRRYEIGIVFQMHYLFKGMTALENIEIASLLARQKPDRSIMEALEIDHVMSHKASELSGGQQQRVSIARVLSKKPRIIFADEPTGNLDRESSDLVMGVMLDYISEVKGALFLVTHDPEVASRCDRVVRLEDRTIMDASAV